MRLNSSATAVLSAGTKNPVKTSSSAVKISVVKSLVNTTLIKSSSPQIESTSGKNVAITSLNIGISALQNPSVKNLVKASLQSKLNPGEVDVEIESGKLTY